MIETILRDKKGMEIKVTDEKGKEEADRRLVELIKQHDRGWRPVSVIDYSKLDDVKM